MFIDKITINNFRIFNNKKSFELDCLNTPDGITEGSGLNLFIGENGCGKTSLLDSFALPFLSYKAESISLDDFFDPSIKINIQIFSKENFNFKGTMPNSTYIGKGFEFEAGIRSRENKSFLSSIIVSDQKYIRADNETKPEDGKPDLRLNVNNPWSGPRFNENDILFLDKNRTYQTRSGSYNKTRFDKLMEDFNYQYIKKTTSPIDCNEKFSEVADGIENDFLSEAIDKFNEISGEKLSLGFVDNWMPYANGFFGVERDNKQYVSLDKLGSGYEIIFSILYSFYLSKQSGKQLIIIIDEPELHLHPKLQEEFVKIIIEFSKTSQIFLTTHSPLLVKQVLYNKNVKINILKKETEKIVVNPIDSIVLPYLSANEVNFLAFGLPTEEYHNELYNEIESKFWDDTNNDFKSLKQTGSYDKSDCRQIIFDNEFFGKIKGEEVNQLFKKIPNKVTIHTYIRNKIHHSNDNNGCPSSIELEESIKKMREFLKTP